MIAPEIQLEKQKSSTRPEIISFLADALRSQHDFSVREEYPALFREFPGGESLVLTRSGEILSHVGYVVREFQCAEYRMKVGLIGSVVTRKDCRGQGAASRLLKKAFDELKLRGCVIAVLWSEHPQFYFPLGFYRAGRERDLKFSEDSVPDPSLEVRVANPSDANQIWRLYQRNRYKLDRSLEEQKHLLKIPKAETYVTGDPVSAYVVINKGADFTDYIHEWGGNPQEVTSLIAYCQKQVFKDRQLTLIAPDGIDLNPIKQYAVERWYGAVGLFKILDKTMLLSEYENFLRRQDIAYSWNREHNGLFFGKDEFFLRNDEEIIKHIFGEGGTPKTHPELPFFLWGFDSI